MPLKPCYKNGQPGWKYGDHGHCYTGPDAKQKAIKQAVAINKDKERRGEKPEPIYEQGSNNKDGLKKYVKRKLRGT